MNTVAIEIPYNFDPAPLRKAVEDQGMTNRDLGSKSGYHEVHVCRILQGKTPSERAIRRLCEVLNVPVEEVLRPL